MIEEKQVTRGLKNFSTIQYAQINHFSTPKIAGSAKYGNARSARIITKTHIFSRSIEINQHNKSIVYITNWTGSAGFTPTIILKLEAIRPLKVSAKFFACTLHAHTRYAYFFAAIFKAEA